MKHKAVFLDKDGTIIPDIPYNVDTDLITLSDGVVEGLQLLQSYGYLLVIVSNQSGIARGYFTTVQMENVKDAIVDMFMKVGIYFDGFYYCPHHPDGSIDGFNSGCNCRKPAPGLLLKAADDLEISLDASWMIGDILNDVEAGNRAGCRTVLINNGNETEWVPGTGRIPEYFANDLAEAARYILAAQKVTANEKKLDEKAEYTMHQAG